MSEELKDGRVTEALLPEHDVHVDDAVSLGRGELPRDEALRVRGRMLTDPAYRAVVEPIVLAYDEPPLDEEGAEIGWANFAREAGLAPSVVEAAVGTDEERARRERRRSRRWFVRAAAAVFVGLFVLPYAIYAAKMQYDIERAYGSVSTGPGETTVYTLPDGTVATLGPSSELRYYKEMLVLKSLPAELRIRKGRQVFPKGDITFQVPHIVQTGADDRADMVQFRAETDHATIMVMGTRFRVLSNERSTLVEVQEGSVLAYWKLPRDLWDKNLGVQKLTLGAGESGRFNRDGYGQVLENRRP